MNKVSDETLLYDIELTKKELLAYEKLREGFSILSSIPENMDPIQAKLYNFESDKYHSLAQECAKFLHKLLDLRSKRKLR